MGLKLARMTGLSDINDTGLLVQVNRGDYVVGQIWLSALAAFSAEHEQDGLYNVWQSRRAPGVMRGYVTYFCTMLLKTLRRPG